MAAIFLGLNVLICLATTQCLQSGFQMIFECHQEIHSTKNWFDIRKHLLMFRGARFTNGFSTAIQIRWKFRFTLTSILIQWSLRNFVHGTTAVLLWHVQKFVAIWLPATELWQGEVSFEFELRAKNR